MEQDEHHGDVISACTVKRHQKYLQINKHLNIRKEPEHLRPPPQKPNSMTSLNPDKPGILYCKQTCHGIVSFDPYLCHSSGHCPKIPDSIWS